MLNKSTWKDFYVCNFQNAHFVVCLDSLAASKDIYIHYSKPPKDGTPTANFLQVSLISYSLLTAVFLRRCSTILKIFPIKQKVLGCNDKTLLANLFQELTNAAAELEPHMKVDFIHKKINLAEKRMAWEHERLSMKRIAGFTASSLKVLIKMN